MSREPIRGRGVEGDTLLVDTHAHLGFPEFDGDRDEVCRRAWDAGIAVILDVGSGQGIDGNHRAIELAETDPRIFAIIGVHPHDADAFSGAWLERLETMIGHGRVVAVGEAGLDYYRRHSSPDAQKECFRAQLGLAHRCGKPIVVHDRDAHEDVWRIIEQEGVPSGGGVFHCYSGDIAFAEKIIAAGMHLSFNGIITFPTAHDLQGVASAVPLDRVLLETDCPYLAPVPHRGKRNEPAYLSHVARVLADIKGLDVTDVARITTLNARKLFGLPGADMEPRIAYRIRNTLYLNITNRCNLVCGFCPKVSGDDYEMKGHCLKLAHEPDIEQIFLAMGHPEEYDEVVFCGFGEPTKRLELVKEVAGRMKGAGVKRIRLNTDGLANLVYGRNVLYELKGLIDAVSVSLNAHDAATYATICVSPYGERAYEEVKAFIRTAKECIPEVVATVVSLPNVDVDSCRRIVEQELGVAFRIREYVKLGRSSS